MSPLPLVLFADVEQLLVEHLRTALAASAAPYAAGAQVGTVVPDPRPDVFVLVRRVGGLSPRFAVDEPRVDLQDWHRTDVEAHDLMQLLRGLLQQARGVGAIRSVRENSGPLPVPDDDGTPRYVCTLDLTLKGATA
jgi:hypothetical protein